MSRSASHALLLLLSLLLPACTLAQSSAASTQPAFDVASVRPSRADASPHSNVPLDSGNVYNTVDPEDARSPTRLLQPQTRSIAFVQDDDSSDGKMGIGNRIT